MGIDIIDKIEEKCEIDLDWFYHSVYYDRIKYLSILSEGIKCNKLLNSPGCGRYNGKYYISLSKLTVPDNVCYLYYTTDRPSFIIDDIEPIKCRNIAEYQQYIDTRDPRRIGNFEDEYQYYYFIKSTYIKGIVYNLLECFIKRDNRFNTLKIRQLLDLINLLEELDVKIPIYDYSRRDKALVHKINKEKLKYYFKELI